MRRKRLASSLLATSLFFFAREGLPGPVSSGSETMALLTTDLVVGGLNDPVDLGMPNGDFERLFVVEQAGRIQLVRDGAVTGTYLDIVTRVLSGGERGLLGIAFHPNYSVNGYFYVNYTRQPDGATVVARFQVTANPDVADPNSEQILFTVSQPFSNHNGGCLKFGPDGKLYIGLGDGGSGNDPGNRAQNGGVLLGKMLRLDVDSGSPYGIPPDNPFVGPGDPLDEIWNMGLRNPWRFSFDRQTGDFWIGDVGQDAREEINFQLASSVGGENYGWRCMEGTRCTGLSGCTCNDVALALPVHEYSHVAGCYSVTGGFVYRGCDIPDLDGTYFFADYCRAQIWSFRYVNGQKTEFMDRTAELDPPGALRIDAISSFGEDPFGRLYIVDYNGELYRIVPQTPPAPDCNGNGVSDGCDIAVGYSQDVNGDGIPDECQLLLTQGPLIRGQTTTFTVDWADPGETVIFLFGTNGTGNGPCFFGAALCLDLLNPVYLAGSVPADGTGQAVFNVPIPSTAPLIGVDTQAVAIRGGTGHESIKSNTVSDTVQ